MGIKYIDYFQMIFWFLGAVGVIFTIEKGLRDLRDSTTSRRAELRWKQAAFAMELIKDLQANENAKFAFETIDYSEKNLTIPNVPETVSMNYQKLAHCLRTEQMALDKTDVFVRGAYDELLELTARMEWAIASDLVLFDDVSRVWVYYVQRLKANPELWAALVNYMGFSDIEAAWSSSLALTNYPFFLVNKLLRRKTKAVRGQDISLDQAEWEHGKWLEERKKKP